DDRMWDLTVLIRMLHLLVLAMVACMAFGQQTIAEYSGNGLSNTRPFTVQNDWEIQWSVSGDIFQVYIYDVAGDLVGVAANQSGAGEGTSFNARGGTYYLQVNAIGAWTVSVVQLQAGAGSQVSVPVTIEGDGMQNSRPFHVTGPWEIQWTANGDIFQVYI